MSVPQERLQEDSTQVPTKKARTRGSAACDACRIRRSRCDLIDSLGCHRCKQLGTNCSFRNYNVAESLGRIHGEIRVSLEAGAGSSSSSQNMTSAPRTAQINLQALVDRIGELESRLQLLSNGTVASSTSDLAALPSHPFDYSGPAARTPTDTLSIPGLDGDVSLTRPIPALQSGRPSEVATSSDARATANEPERDETWYQRWADPETFSSIHHMIHSKKELGLRDPIKEGIIPEAQAGAVYQMFQFHFAAIHPNPKLLVVRPQLPSHPFFLSAALYYTVRCTPSMQLFTPSQIHLLEQYLFANLNAYHRGCRPSLEGIMAAFILSFLPPGTPQEAFGQADLDPARMIGLAYAQTRELGQSVFIERLARHVEQGVPIRHLDQPLDDARVFMSVINRSAWFSYSRCPWSTTPTLVENSQRRLLEVLQNLKEECELDRHLIFEHAILQVLYEHSQIWQTLQSSILPAIEDVLSGNNLVRSSHSSFEQQLLKLELCKDLRSKAYLRCHVTYCMWWVAVRNLWAIYRLAVPLIVDNMYSAWLEAISLAADAARNMLVSCVRQAWRLEALPHAIGNAIVICYAAIETGILHIRHLYPSEPLPLSLDIPQTLHDVQGILKTSGNELSGLLLRTQEKLSEYRQKLELGQHARYQSDSVSLPPGDFNFGTDSGSGVGGEFQMMSFLMGEGNGGVISGGSEMFPDLGSLGGFGSDGFWPWQTFQQAEEEL